jgi:uncharacterized protein (DUF697 family)
VSKRAAEAAQIVRRYAFWSAGAGVIPIPYVDLAAVTAVQLRMLADLSHHYGVESDETKTEAVLTSMLGTLAVFTMGSHGIPGNLIRALPLLGPVAILSKPFLSGAVTFGLGNVFITHFESGGRLEDIDPESPQVREAYRKGVRRAARSALPEAATS